MYVISTNTVKTVKYGLSLQICCNNIGNDEVVNGTISWNWATE